MNLISEAPLWLALIFTVLLVAAGLQDAFQARMSNKIVLLVIIGAMIAAAVVGPQLALWQNVTVFAVLLTLGTAMHCSLEAVLEGRLIERRFAEAALFPSVHPRSPLVDAEPDQNERQDDEVARADNERVKFVGRSRHRQSSEQIQERKQDRAQRGRSPAPANGGRQKDEHGALDFAEAGPILRRYAARFDSFCRIRQQLRRTEEKRRIAALQHHSQLFDIGFAAAEAGWQGKRDGPKTGIDCAEEAGGEFRASLGNERDAIAGLQA